MDNNRWERLAPLTGILAVALWIVGALMLFSDEPGSGASPEEIAAYFEDDAGKILAGGFLFMLGVAAFLWFVGTLRAALARAEGDVGRIAGIAAAGGVATASMLFGMVAPHAAGRSRLRTRSAARAPRRPTPCLHSGTGSSWPRRSPRSCWSPPRQSPSSGSASFPGGWGG
jgi:hypothetical protein